MGYGILEGDVLRDKAQEALAAEKNLEAANTIAAFFKTNDKVQSGSVTQTTCSHTDPARIIIASSESGLCVRHRGHEVQVSSTQPAALEAEFRQWCKKYMSHAKVFPRK
jgi:hypothetical protein